MKMKWQSKVQLAALGWLIFAASCVTQDVQEENPGTDQILALEQTWLDTYHQKDAVKLASLWTEDGFYVDLSAQISIQGRKAIEEYFRDFFQSQGEKERAISKSEIQFKDAFHAARYSLVNVTYKNKEVDHCRLKAEYVKKDDKWQIEKLVRVCQEPIPSHFEELKPLGSFVGDWEEEDGHAEFTTSWKWGRNNNFLMRHFTLKILEHRELDGVEIIGFDAAKGQIRSWVFDSDGGYGVAFWFQEGPSWYVNLTFTLPDGRMGSATHVYTKVDENSYTFSANSRDIEGQIFPDIGPYKVVRKKEVAP